MKFTLTYDGQLPSAGNRDKRTREKQAIREHISPQLAELWRINPSLRHALTRRYVPRMGGYLMGDTHHDAVDEEEFTPTAEQMPHVIDMCAEVERGGIKFMPLVRSTYRTICGLSILFLRPEPEGKVYQGGDLDNRLKTLLDALSVPTLDQVSAAPPSEGTSFPIHCLLEDDSLIASIEVQTRRLLTWPGANEKTVRLVIEVDVRVPDVRGYNTLFLGD
jgi:hypothetical protein